MNEALKSRIKEATSSEIPEILDLVKSCYDKIPSHRRGVFNQLKEDFADQANNFKLSDWKARFGVWLSSLDFEITASTNSTSDANANGGGSNPIPKSVRSDIFISYSHHPEDKPYFDEVQRQLKTLKAYGLDVHVWDDTQIRAGDDWLAEIKNALAKTKVGVLLVSPNFLASKFIGEKEVPALLEAVNESGGKIMSLILRKTLFERHPILGRYQSVNPPGKPLNAQSEVEKDECYAKLLEDILHLYEQN